MPRNKPRFPKPVTTPVELEAIPTLHEALFANGLSSEESLALLAGDISSINEARRKRAELEIEKAIFQTSTREAMAKLEKLIQLRDHYGIKPDLDMTSWFFILLCRLSDDLIPGFGVAKPSKAGRRKDRWSPLQQLRYIREVEKIKDEHNCSDKMAVKIYLDQLHGVAATNSEIASGRARLSEARNTRKNPFYKMIPPEGHPHRMSALEDLIEVFESMENY